nr:reverse transcriptase [Tanacetum cinerariifolium]
MPFDLHSNALDFAIGGVLMQDGQPIVFKSQKLNEMERKMKDGVETFVRMYLLCQQDKIEQKKPRGLLEPLPTPKGHARVFPWIYHMLADVKREWKYYNGGGSILEIYEALLDGVVKDHKDGFELLYEFSSPSGRANEEGQCTIRALSSALSTWKIPFELVTKRQPLTPNALAALYEKSSPTTYKTMKE